MPQYILIMNYIICSHKEALAFFLFIYFIYGSFNDTIGGRQYIVMTGRLVSESLERMWKKVVVAKSEVPSQNVSGRSEENHENP